MSEQSREHFRISEVDSMVPKGEPKPRPGYKYYDPDSETSFISKSTYALWVFGSWAVVLINMGMACICIRDMFNVAYNPMIHWFMSAAFVATLGGLVSIHTYILKR